MSQINDVWSWGQESSETNEDNSASTDNNDWDDNSWGNSWDNNEIIQNEQQPVKSYNNEKQQTTNMIYSTLQSQGAKVNQHSLYKNNVNSYNQDHQYYQHHGEIVENQNYNAQGNPSHPYENLQHQYIDHNNEQFNYTQAVSPTDSTTLNEYHNGQTYYNQSTDYGQHVNQAYLYNSVIKNGAQVDKNQDNVQYNQNSWYNPTEQVQHFQPNQNVYLQPSHENQHLVNPDVQVTSDVYNQMLPNNIHNQISHDHSNVYNQLLQETQPVYNQISHDNSNVYNQEISQENRNINQEPSHSSNNIILLTEDQTSVDSTSSIPSDNSSVLLNTGSHTHNCNNENEHLLYNQPNTSISLSGSKKNSWYEDEEPENISVDTSLDQNVENYATTITANSSHNEDIIGTVEPRIDTDTNTENSQEVVHTEFTNQELETSNSNAYVTKIENNNQFDDFFNKIIQQEQRSKENNSLLQNRSNFEGDIDTSSKEPIVNESYVSSEVVNVAKTEDNGQFDDFFNTIIQQETSSKENNTLLQFRPNLEGDIDPTSKEQIVNDSQVSSEVFEQEIIQKEETGQKEVVQQEEKVSENVGYEKRIPTNLSDTSENKEQVPVLPLEQANDPVPIDRVDTATPYDNLCEGISSINLLNQARSSLTGVVDTPDANNILISSSEEKPMKITDRLKGGPKKFMHLKLKTDQPPEAVSTPNLPTDKLSRLKRDSEKTTKDRNEYLETGKLQDSESDMDENDDNDEAPSFVRMIPGSEMSDANVTQSNTIVRQCHTLDTANRADTTLSTTGRKQTKSKRQTHSSNPQDSGSSSNEDKKVDDKKLMRMIKTIMSEEKSKKMRSKKNGKDNLETTALRIAELLKAQEHTGSIHESSSDSSDKDNEEEQNSSYDRKSTPHNNSGSKRLTDFEKYMNSLQRRKQDSEKSLKPSFTSPVPLEDRMSAMSLQDRDKYPERLQRPFPQRTPPAHAFPTSPGQSYPERPFPQRTPPSHIYPERGFSHRTPPTQTYSERSMRSPFTDVCALDRRHTRKSTGDSFSSHLQFLSGILANFPAITPEQSDRMKRLSLSYPLEYKSWYMESYLPTLRRYKERITEKTTVMRNRINKQFGKHCIGKFRLSSLMKFEGTNIRECLIDVQREFQTHEDSNYFNDIELLTPFTFDNEDKKCFYNFIQSMIPKASSLSEQLLYQLIELMFKSRGELELSDVGELLLRSYAKVKGSRFLSYPESELWRPRNTEEENFKLRQHVVNNQKQKAFQLALQTKDWALATVLSSLPNSNVSRAEVHDAFLANLPANDPLRSCFRLMFKQNIQFNDNTPIVLDDWGIHLAAILNNSTPNTLNTAAILNLGHMLGSKGDFYGEQFCTLTVNAPWLRFKLLGAPCERTKLDSVVTGRNLLLSMAFENAAKLQENASSGYQFVQLQYMKYYFALKLLRTGKKQMALHFLHHASEEVLNHLAQFSPAHISLIANIVDCAGLCAGGEAQGLLWYSQLQHLLTQYLPARCVTLPPLEEPEDFAPSPSPSTTQPEYSTTQPGSSLSHYDGHVERPDPIRQTPVSQNMGEGRINTSFNPTGSVPKPEMSGPRSFGNEMARAIANEFAPKSLGSLPNDYGPKPVGNIPSLTPGGNIANLPPSGNPQRASAFNKPRPTAVRNNPLNAGNSQMGNGRIGNRSAPYSETVGSNSLNTPLGNINMRSISNTPMGAHSSAASTNPMASSTPINNALGSKLVTSNPTNASRNNPLRSNPLRNNATAKPTEAAYKPTTSQFFTPTMVQGEQSSYMQHLQDSETSAAINQISLNSKFSYAAQDSHANGKKASNGQQLASSAIPTTPAGATSGGGWFGFLRKNKPALSGENSAQGKQESSQSSGKNDCRAPTPQQSQYPESSYSAPPQPYLPDLSQSNVQSGFYQPQQQSYSRSSSPASSLSTEVRYYTSRQPAWNQQYRNAPHQ